VNHAGKDFLELIQDQVTKAATNYAVKEACSSAVTK
jgi:hypothetical protein